MTVKAGDFLTANQVQEWLAEEHSSFWDTFQPNLMSDWRHPLDIAQRLNKMANRLDQHVPTYCEDYGMAEIKGGMCRFKPLAHTAFA